MTHPWASRDDQKQSSVLHGTLLGKDVCGDFVYVLYLHLYIFASAYKPLVAGRPNESK